MIPKKSKRLKFHILEVLLNILANGDILRPYGHIGTWESLVLGFANEANLQKLRKSRPRHSHPQVTYAHYIV